MIKFIYRFTIVIVTIFLLTVIYLSIVGINTDRFNNQISKQIKNINKDLDVELKQVNIVLDPFNFEILLKTLGTDLKYMNNIIELERIKTNISIKSFVSNQFSLKKINISTKSIEIKNLISFIRLIQKDPKLFVAEKMINKGYLISDIKIEFDENGNIKDNFEINGIVKQGKINFFDKYNLSKLDFIFFFNKDSLKIENFKLVINDKNFLLPKSNIKKSKDKFLISGILENKKISLNKNEIEDLFGQNIFDSRINKIEFLSINQFSFDLDNKFKLKNLRVNSDINLLELNAENKEIKEIFPELEKEIKFKNHKINLIYNKKIIDISGSGDFFVKNKKDQIKYEILKNKDSLDFKTYLEIKNNKFKINFLNYDKDDNSNLQLSIKGTKDLKKNILFDEIFLNEKENNIKIKNLLLKDNFSLIKFKSIYLNYLDNEKIKNKISIIKQNNNYILNGVSLNINKIIKNVLDNENKNQKLFNQDFKIKINLEKVYLDKYNFINELEGHLFLKDNNLYEANLSSKFSNNNDMKLTIKTENKEKITTLFSSEAKPIVDRYKFIKGFNDGSLDFYSTKKNNITKSTLRIYDFKLKELPALTKLLTLASLQGIADLLSGEGIRFNEFEMNFSSKDKMMTIEEIYAIGPAISIMMNGYIEKDKVVSLRGTLVPATTINKTIGSIPLLGDILVGKKSGEGIFGVSFKIKGPPKKLETSVNPIKSLTPRFITRTLEKIKKN